MFKIIFQLRTFFHKRILIYTAIFFLIIFLIISPVFPFLIKDISFKEVLLNFAFIGLFLLIPTIIFHKKLTVYYFLIAIYCSLTPALFLPLLLTGEQISPEIIITTIHSNFREINELLGWNLLLLLVSMILFFIAVFYLTKFLPKKIETKTCFYISGTSLFLLIFIVFADGKRSISLASNFKLEFTEKYPFGLAASTYSILKNNQLEDHYTENTRQFSFGAFKTYQSQKRNIEVLVIGESARYDHWTINGYTRNTSPFLSTEKNLISFSNVSTGATLTLKSIPFLITRMSVDSISQHLKEKSLLAAFKEAGFYTAWISNQYGANQSVASEFHTADCDTTIFINTSIEGDKSFLTPGLYDEALLQPFKKLIDQTSKDVFIVIHTMGSHWRYKFRYPPEYEIFKTDEGNSSMSSVINEYDNSILYTDYLLHLIIAKLETTAAISSLIYVSDHGENLKDNGDNLMYHTATPSYYTAHVPLFVWLSDSIKKQRPEIERNLLLNQTKKISTIKSIFYTAMDIGGINIKIDDNLQRFSLASSEYKDHDQLISGESNVIYSFKELEDKSVR